MITGSLVLMGEDRLLPLEDIKAALLDCIPGLRWCQRLEVLGCLLQPISATGLAIWIYI